MKPIKIKNVSYDKFVTLYYLLFLAITICIGFATIHFNNSKLLWWMIIPTLAGLFCPVPNTPSEIEIPITSVKDEKDEHK